MKAQKLILLAVVIILALSCNENSTEPVGSKGFSVKLKARTLGGAPLAGIRVSAWNHLSLPVAVPSGFAASQRQSVQPTPAVSFRFDLGADSRVTFNILELNDTLVSTPIDQLMAAGVHLLQWQVPQPIVPTRVFKYRLVARDMVHDSILFEDLKYALLWQQDPSATILGWTSSDGEFQTRDSLLFPDVIPLPPLVFTDETGPDSLGTFTIRDTVTFVLTDTATNREMEFVKPINRGVENDINLIWNPAAAKPASTRAFEQPMSGSELSVRDSVVSVLPGWKLYQSYPNPFY